jgi:predicted RNA-binding Zn-ribbon protein involved in translation (DUF1610 family)
MKIKVWKCPRCKKIVNVHPTSSMFKCGGCGFRNIKITRKTKPLGLKI